MNLDALRKQIQSMQHLIGTRPAGFYVTPAIRDDQPVHWVVQVDDNHNEWLVLETDDQRHAETRCASMRLEAT